MRQWFIYKARKELARTTPVLVISVASILLLSGVVIFYIPDQSAGLGVAYALMLILLLAIAFLLDRAAVRKYKLSKVAYIEVAGIVVLLIYIFWSSRSTKLIVKTEHNHFVVI